VRIRSLTDVRRAERLNQWLSRPDVEDVRIEADIAEPERTRVQSRIADLYNDCGCIWGPPAFVLSFAAVALPQILYAGFSWRVLAGGFLIGAAAAILAKLTALYVSHIRLRRLLHQLGQRFPIAEQK